MDDFLWAFDWTSCRKPTPNPTKCVKKKEQPMQATNQHNVVNCHDEAIELIPMARQEIPEPKRCPICGEPTTRTMRGKPGAVLYCSNNSCPGVGLGKVDHWIGTSKKGTGILGIGDTILKALWGQMLVSDPADLYTLTVDMIKDVELEGGMRIGESRAHEIIKNIASKKKLSLSTFFGSLGIDLLGRRRVEILKEAANGQLDTLDDWLDDQKLATIQLPGFGDTIRDSVREGINACRPLIKKLLSVGVTVGEPVVEQKAESGAPQLSQQEGKPLAGISCCWTGTRAYIDEFQALGGIVKSGISKGLHLLCQKDPTSSSNKTLKAEQYGTKIIGLDCLKQLISGEITPADIGLSPERSE